MRKIIRNAIRCNYCGDVIVSTASAISQCMHLMAEVWYPPGGHSRGRKYFCGKKEFILSVPNIDKNVILPPWGKDPRAEAYSMFQA